MINIILSLVLYFCVKPGFLRLFVSKDEGDRPMATRVPRAEDDASLVERHDRRGIGSSLRSEVKGVNRLGVKDIDSPAFTLGAVEHFMEGR